MARKEREANYELLRILAMVMVVVMHFLSHSDYLLALDMPISSVRLAGSVLEAFCLVAVNVYILISGYFGVRGSFRISKAAALLGQIWFYALLIPIALKVLKVPAESPVSGIYRWIQYIFPIETEHYWFATSYFMLYLLMPVLNTAVRNMPQKQLKIILGCLLTLFCGIKSITPVAFAFDRYGYDLAWFICVYLLAAYLGIYGWGFFEKRGWLVYVVSALVSFGINAAMWALSGWQDSFRYYFTVPFHYNFIFCLLGAVGLFYGFSRIHIKEGRAADFIRRLGGLCFGVYLLHEHVDLRFRWYGWIKGMINPGNNEGILFFFLELFCCTIILFAAGIFIDWLRSILFAKGTKFFLKMRKPDEE